MKDALSRLRDIAHGNRSQNLATLLEYSPLDVDKISSDMDLEKQGDERGKKGEPLTGSNALDTIQREIVDKIHSFQQDAVEQLTGQLDICSERMRQLQFDAMVTSVKSETSATVTDFEQEARNGENTLFQLRRELVDATEALEEFKRHNVIQRPALKRPNTLVTVFVVLAVFVIESVANAGLMGSAHEAGYIGAYTLAVSLSFINVIAGFSAGFFGLRWAHHHKWPHRLWGVSVVGAFIFSIFAFNLYIAHVRDAMQSGGLDEALGQVWPKLLSFSFNFHDYQAPLMLIIGIAFSLVAFYKGFKNDDPYPDYGRQSRLRDSAEAIYANIAASLGDHLSEHRDEIKSILQKVSLELGFRRSEYFSITTTIGKLTSRFRTHEKHLESSAQRLLNIYRDANRKARRKGEPKHFKKEFEINESYVEAPAVDEIYPKDRVESLIEEAKELIERSISDVDMAHRNAFKRYDMISQILDKKSLDEAATVSVSEGEQLDDP